jgi:YD repeat-containing protein
MSRLIRLPTFIQISASGRIYESIDAITGEDVQYTHDSLQRLVRAETTGPQWGNAYAYDGFGNLLTKTVTKGSAPMMSAAAIPEEKGR